jgi:uncharacterized membrane protein
LRLLWVKVDAMRNIILILAFLLVPFFGLAPFGVAEVSRGRIATTCVFLFTGSGHFLQSKAMSEMIPLQVPKPFRLSIIYASGVFEIVAAIAVLVPDWSRAVGVLLCLFLVGVLPVNIDAAIRHVPFGGHGAGPSYLLVRVPLQVALLCWIYWFDIRSAA